MCSTNVKNEREKFHHRGVIKSLGEEQKQYDVRSRKELHGLQQELLHMMAYRNVYRNYSFYRTRSAPTASARNTGVHNKMVVRHARGKKPREVVKDENHCDDSDNDKDSANNADTSSGDTQDYTTLRFTYEDDGPPLSQRLEGDGESDFTRGDQTGERQTIESLEHVLSNPDNKPENKEPEVGQICSPDEQPLTEVIGFQPLRGIAARRRQNTRSGNGGQRPVNKPHQQPPVWKRITRDRPPERKLKIFPEDCSSAFTFRRLIDKKAESLAADWSPENARKQRVKEILRNHTPFPGVVQRNKSTSAIFRDYNQYKMQSEGCSSLDKPTTFKTSLPRIKCSGDGV